MEESSQNYAPPALTSWNEALFFTHWMEAEYQSQYNSKEK
jgi:hypothetical protein